MSKIAYQSINMSQARLDLVDTCNEVIAEYKADGLLLTLRQLYYQLVSRGIIPNRQQEYKRLGDIVNDARLSGLMDWNAIEDRTRELVVSAHWDSPEDIISACAGQFRVDRWAEQDVHVEVWIEKEALSGVFERICKSLDVGCFACRGYTSQSEMWAGAMRFVDAIKQGKDVVVFHFGDHDPSGIDMSRDIEERIRMFAAHHVGDRSQSMIKINRLALNMDQVERYNPPENPAKVTDSRFASYAAAYGDKSWELDALNPKTLAALVRDNVLSVCDKSLWTEIIDQESRARGELCTIYTNYGDVIDHLESDDGTSGILQDHVKEARTAIRQEIGDGSADE